MTRFLLLTAAVVLSSAAASAQTLPVRPERALAAAPAARADERVYELRTYYAAAGKLDALHDRFRRYALPLLERHGVTNLGYWVPADNPDNKLVFLVSYPSRAARDQAWAGFAADPDWLRVKRASETDGRLVQRLDEQLLAPTDYSPDVTPAAGREPRVFELQTYTAKADEAAALHDHFRSGGQQALEARGVTNVGYWTVVPTRPGGDVTLVALVAHPTAAAREKSLAVARADSLTVTRSMTVNKASAPASVEPAQTLVLKPTDYSPIK